MRLDAVGISWLFQEGSYPNQRSYQLGFTQNDARARGTFSLYETQTKWPFTATLSGNRDIQIRSDDGSIQMTGSLQKDPSYFFVLNLIVHGGPLDGRSVTFRVHDSY